MKPRTPASPPPSLTLCSIPMDLALPTSLPLLPHRPPLLLPLFPACLLRPRPKPHRPEASPAVSPAHSPAAAAQALPEETRRASRRRADRGPSVPAAPLHRHKHQRARPRCLPPRMCAPPHARRRPRPPPRRQFQACAAGWPPPPRPPLPLTRRPLAREPRPPPPAAGRRRPVAAATVCGRPCLLLHRPAAACPRSRRRVAAASALWPTPPGWTPPPMSTALPSPRLPLPAGRRLVGRRCRRAGAGEGDGAAVAAAAGGCHVWMAAVPLPGGNRFWGGGETGDSAVARGRGRRGALPVRDRQKYAVHTLPSMVQGRRVQTALWRTSPPSPPRPPSGRSRSGDVDRGGDRGGGPPVRSRGAGGGVRGSGDRGGRGGGRTPRATPAAAARPTSGRGHWPTQRSPCRRRSPVPHRVGPPPLRPPPTNIYPSPFPHLPPFPPSLPLLPTPRLTRSGRGAAAEDAAPPPALPNPSGARLALTCVAAAGGGSGGCGSGHCGPGQAGQQTGS